MDVSPGGIHHVTFIVEDKARAKWFYEDVLGFEEKYRPKFKFPGLFYRCGDQEIHLIVSSRPQGYSDIFITIDGKSEESRRHIHRHAAFLVQDVGALRARLEENGVKILYDPNAAPADDQLAVNMAAGWREMYGEPPIFCLDPFGNLIELVPEQLLGRS